MNLSGLWYVLDVTSSWNGEFSSKFGFEFWINVHFPGNSGVGIFIGLRAGSVELDQDRKEYLCLFLHHSSVNCFSTRVTY